MKKLLEGLRVVTIALNLPGPAACARLRDLGAAVTKVEPPAGDPFEQYCPSWYRRLHEEMAVERIDLKTLLGRSRLGDLLVEADLLVTAQRPSALARLGLSPDMLAAKYRKLCHVAITGHPAPDEETPGHDLTYLAVHGLLSPPAMPATLYADMAGSERAVSTALALVISRDRSGGRGKHAQVPLEDGARALAQPLREGLTAPGAILGGGLAGYNVYATRTGWIAIAALEPHFAQNLASALGFESLDSQQLRERFASDSAENWESWARERDLPLVALRNPSQESTP